LQNLEEVNKLSISSGKHKLAAFDYMRNQPESAVYFNAHWKH